jgi:hypothetical protein
MDWLLHFSGAKIPGPISAPRVERHGERNSPLYRVHQCKLFENRGLKYYATNPNRKAGGLLCFFVQPRGMLSEHTPQASARLQSAHFHINFSSRGHLHHDRKLFRKSLTDCSMRRLLNRNLTAKMGETLPYFALVQEIDLDRLDDTEISRESMTKRLFPTLVGRNCTSLYLFNLETSGTGFRSPYRARFGLCSCLGSSVP